MGARSAAEAAPAARTRHAAASKARFPLVVFRDAFDIFLILVFRKMPVSAPLWLMRGNIIHASANIIG